MANRAGELISVYSALFYVSMGIAIVGLILAVVIFFLFDIPMVFAIRSGRMERQTVEKLNRRSAKVGNFGARRHAKESGTAEMKKRMSNLRMESSTGDMDGPRSQGLEETEELVRTAPQEQTAKLDEMAAAPTTTLKPPEAAQAPVKKEMKFTVFEEIILSDTQERI